MVERMLTFTGNFKRRTSVILKWKERSLPRAGISSIGGLSNKILEDEVSRVVGDLSEVQIVDRTAKLEIPDLDCLI